MLFLFLAAMFGLVLSQNLIWIYFFWEITSVISFLMIGYTRTEEAVNNSFCALWMNLLGGLGFAVAIAIMAQISGSLQLIDRKSTRLNSSHVSISYAVFCLKKNKY